MRSGLLRHTVAIQEQTDVSDGMGGFTTTWTDVSGMEKVPAAIWPMRGTEKLEAMKLEYKEPREIRIRYRSGITAKNRIYWADKSKPFNIISTNNFEERNRVLDIICTEEI